MPKTSDLARKRKVQSNPPVDMKRSKKGRNSAFAPKYITPPYDHVKEHPGDDLTVTTGTLFCSACREQLSVKSQVINIQSSPSIQHPVGEKLPKRTRIYRVKVVTAFLKAGVPLSKIDSTSVKQWWLCFVLRYVDDDWQIKQQVCLLMLVAKSMTGMEVACQLIAFLLSFLLKQTMW